MTARRGPVPAAWIAALALGALPAAAGAGQAPPAAGDERGAAKADPAARPRRHGKARVEGTLNVNRASEAELRLLPGIGKTRAAQIVARRDKRPFASLEDLARLRGLRKLVQRLRPHLSVSGDTTLRPAPP